MRTHIPYFLKSAKGLGNMLIGVQEMLYPNVELMTPLIYQTGPKTSANSGCSCSMREKPCINGRSRASGIMGIRS